MNIASQVMIQYRWIAIISDLLYRVWPACAHLLQQFQEKFCRTGAGCVSLRGSYDVLCEVATLAATAAASFRYKCKRIAFYVTYHLPGQMLANPNFLVRGHQSFTGGFLECARRFPITLSAF